ncbi:hypothetical protein RB195_021179 [Necator americanus]|uniref:Uncharacterized protein n=1 Tax=Necator americanus TaxID=51031 RepID=A0ABR1E9S4_NECAM
MISTTQRSGDARCNSHVRCTGSISPIPMSCVTTPQFSFVRVAALLPPCAVLRRDGTRHCFNVLMSSYAIHPITALLFCPWRRRPAVRAAAVPRWSSQYGWDGVRGAQIESIRFALAPPRRLLLSHRWRCFDDPPPPPPPLLLTGPPPTDGWMPGVS